jgi:tetraacyldisaccharide 4'-kinase
MLKLLSLIYEKVMQARNTLYDKGILRIYKTPPVVVSIGNIEVGGTGKTPFTMALAGELQKRGQRVSILTRGYRGSLKGPVLVQAGHRVEEVGDEALLMARSINLPVIKSPDRVKGALFAYTQFKSEIVILDDGFQHRRIHRDLDIVLTNKDVAHERLLPSGPLREPASSLKRADFIIAMKGISHEGLCADLSPACLVDFKGVTRGLDVIGGKRVLAFCAIGKPDHFFAMVENLGAKAQRFSFGDHHRYTKGDIAEIMDRASVNDIILTTEKDLVKIDPNWFGSLAEKLFAIRVVLEMPGLESIADEIEHLAKDRCISRQG